VAGEPKTDAGHRTVTLPAAIAAALEEHLEKHVAASLDALVFSTSSGGYLARSNWDSTFRRAADAIGLPAVRPHELRHTGATLAAATGATTKELMRRLGHSSPPPRSSTSRPPTTATPRSPVPSTPCWAGPPPRRTTIWSSLSSSR
jgi:integrase